MSVVEPGAAPSGLIDRARNILLKPGETWPVIAAEPATVGSIFKSYVVPLAAVPAICGLIGAVVFGYGAFGVTFRPNIGSAVASAVIQYVLSLGWVFVLGVIIEMLAPQFGGTKDRVQGVKVAAYAATAGWLAGVFMLYPPMAILGLLGLYSLYLLYKGLPVVMGAPPEKATAYTVVVIICAFVIGMVAMMVLTPLQMMGSGLGARGPFAASAPAGEIKVGGTTVDVAKLEAASKQMEAAAKQMQAAADGQGGSATNVEALKVFLPPAVAGYARGEISTSTGGVGGLTGSAAEAGYTKGDATITLKVADVGAAGALAGMAGAFNVSSSEESGGKTKKIGKVNGRMTTEEYDAAARNGSYAVLVGDRFLVEADGRNASLDDLKSAVTAVDAGRLEQMAKTAG